MNQKIKIIDLKYKFLRHAVKKEGVEEYCLDTHYKILSLKKVNAVALTA